MEEEHTAACRSSVVRCRGLPRSDHRTGHGGELLEARAALGTVGVPVGAQGGDVLKATRAAFTALSWGNHRKIPEEGIQRFEVGMGKL